MEVSPKIRLIGYISAGEIGYCVAGFALPTY
jgi:hypothetical protein